MSLLCELAPSVTDEAAERAVYERDGLPPEWALLERHYLDLCHIRRLGMGGVEYRQTSVNDPRRKRQRSDGKARERGNRKERLRRMQEKPSPVRHEGRQPRPVISDRGEWFPSAVEASVALGLHKSAVGHAINSGWRCSGRGWRHARPAETHRHSLQEVA